VRLGIENWKCPIAGIGARERARARARVNLMDQRRFERERDKE